MKPMPSLLPAVAFALRSLTATGATSSPASPWEMAAATERWIVGGAGARFPEGIAFPAREANSLVFVDETWPLPFQHRIDESVTLRISEQSGCYEFVDPDGVVFWTVVPVVPLTWNWISPFRSPDCPDRRGLYSPFRLAREWVLVSHAKFAENAEFFSHAESAGNEEPWNLDLGFRDTCEHLRFTDNPTNLCFTAFACTETNLLFTAAWPTNSAGGAGVLPSGLPGNVLDLYGTSNLLSNSWTLLSSHPATNPPVSFAVDRASLPWFNVRPPHVHGADCLVTTNFVVSPFDGATVYTNVVWSCQTNRPPGETGFFRLGTRADNDDDGVSDALEMFVLHTDPETADTDDDGLTDGEEFALGTDPLGSDTDGDTMPDGWEVANGLDPLDYFDSLLDPDADGLIHAYEYHAGTNPAVPDYEQAHRVMIGPGGDYPNLRAAFRDSCPYAILEIRPGIYEGRNWTDLFVPDYPVLVTSGDGGRSRSVILRTTGNMLSAFYLDGEQGPHTLFQGLDVELNGGPGLQSAFWLGDGNLYSGPGASAFFKNVHVRLGAAPDASMGWRCLHSAPLPTILANCTVDASGVRDAIGVYAIDSPEIVLENCSFLHFPDGNQGISYGVQTESTSANYGRAPAQIPVLLRNVLFDDSFTNALVVAPLECGVHYRTVLQNCIVPSELECPVAATNDTIIASPLCERTGHLTANSPAINAGAPVLYALTDFEGELRNGTPDIGADEASSNPNIDSDGDGLSNLVERTVHGTDPFRIDSDGDGVSDSDEVADGTDPNDDASVCFVLSGVLGGEHPGGSGAKLALVVTNDDSITLLSPAVLIAGTNVYFSFPHVTVTNHPERLLCLFYDDDSDGVPDESESRQFERIVLDGHETRVDAPFHFLTATSDLDADGIPDLWELGHGLSNTNSVDAFEDWDDDGLINLHEYWAGCNPAVIDGTNTLLSILAKSVDNRLVGKNPSQAWPIYHNYLQEGNNGVFILNTNCWAYGLDFSFESPWNDSRYQNKKSGTALSKRHVLFASHYTPDIGTKLYFRGSSGNVYARTIVSTNVLIHLPYSNWPSSQTMDVTIGLLDSDLPGDVSLAKLLPDNFSDSLCFRTVLKLA